MHNNGCIIKIKIITLATVCEFSIYLSLSLSLSLSPKNKCPNSLFGFSPLFFFPLHLALFHIFCVLFTDSDFTSWFLSARVWPKKYSASPRRQFVCKNGTLSSFASFRASGLKSVFIFASLDKLAPLSLSLSLSLSLTNFSHLIHYPLYFEPLFSEIFILSYIIH
ncbi:unnamed protein product [Acanthosepion pharaonis]|uniref:Uncharacterized protein n=1 Tax=Acanthosepion pharaonis TaxID=158019 RepID=A0A812EB40_ACAPH|nr:unnamed protein product [Sepia pharaonis]